MAIADNPSTEFTLNLTEEERTELLNWLEQNLRNKRVEEHRTEAAGFRQHVLHEEKILEQLIHKLRPR
jgi:hypothetical protein